MKIYVAGSWRDKETVQQVQRALMEAGHTITHDWTTEEGGIADGPTGSWTDRAAAGELIDEEKQFLANVAIVDTGAVLAAEAYVGVFEHDLPYRGAWVEFGVALAAGKLCFLIGAQATKCVFSYTAHRMTLQQTIARMKAIEQANFVERTRH